MKKLIGSLLFLGLAAAVIGGCSTKEPGVICNVGRAYPFAVVYTPKAGAPACATTTAATLNNVAQDPNSTSNVWGLEGYFSDKDVNLKVVAIRPGEYVDVDVKDPGGSPLALGNWTSFDPDAKDICTVPTMQPATHGGTTYTVSNLQVLNEPAHPGTELVASVTYSDGTCTADYDVLGVWPAVACGNDDDCDPCPNNPNSANPYGSGIATDFPVACVNGYCNLKGTAGDFPIRGTPAACK